MKPLVGASLALVLALGAAPGAAKKIYQVEPLKEGAPPEAAEKVRDVLAPEAIRILDPNGKPFVDIWLRKEVPTVAPKEETGVRFPQLDEGTLLGVCRFHQKGSDFKGNGFPAGSFTLRYGYQPRDGDHLGVSDSRDFLLLSPVKVDTKVDAMSTKELVKLSIQVAGIKHPTVLFVMPMLDEGAKLPRLVQDEDLDLWTLDCQLPSSTADKQPLRLGIVLVGKAPSA